MKPGISLLLGVVGRKRDQRRKILQYRALLEPGLWLLPGGYYGRHRNQLPPRGLAESSHGKRPTTDRQLSPWEQTALSLMARMETFMPPWAVRVQRDGGGISLPVDPDASGPYSILLTKPHRKGVMLLAPRLSEVLHLPGRPRFDGDYERIRQTLQRYLPGPAFQILADGQVLKEQFIEGAPALAVDAPTRIAAVRTLLDRLAAVCREEQCGNAAAFMAQALEAALASTELPTLMRSLLLRRREAILAQSQHWPLVPSHKSSQIDNVLITSDGRPIMLDFSPKPLPFFYDSLKLCGTERARRPDGSTSSVFARLETEYGGEWLELCRGAGISCHGLTMLDAWLAFMVLEPSRLRVRVSSDWVLPSDLESRAPAAGCVDTRNSSP